MENQSYDQNLMMKTGKSSYQMYKHKQMLLNPHQNQSSYTLFGHQIMKPQKEVHFENDYNLNDRQDVFKSDQKLNTDLSEPMLVTDARLLEQDSRQIEASRNDLFT